MTTATTGRGLVTLVLGGARSGKSRYAESLITAGTRPWVYIAAAEARDNEMAARIAEHQARRQAGWQTVEAPHDIADALKGAPAEGAVLIDCLTLWLSNIMQSAGFDIEAQTTRLQEALSARAGQTVLVANEVGLGIVPDNALGRSFRDQQGTLNQRIAAQADQVVFMVAGLPNFVKGSP